MRYGSVCSGVDAATLAWLPLGWQAGFFSETDPFPAAVLKHRYPEVPNLGDMTTIQGSDYIGKIDLLTGGTPCQSFSFAGLRKGLADHRGHLCLKFAELAHDSAVRWVLWENVPGVLSSNGGGDFAGFLSLLCGWRVEIPAVGRQGARRWRNSGIVTAAPGGFALAWRVLDAQYVRVDGYPRALPQRRRRLFVVGYRGDWRAAAAVLFDRSSLSGNPPPRREAGKDVADAAAPGPRGANATWWNGKNVADTLTCSSNEQRMPDQGRMQAVILNGTPCPDSVRAGGPMVCGFSGAHYSCACDLSGTVCCDGKSSIAERSGIRRLLPVECERLMGFPDHYTRIPWRNKPEEECPDGPRYKACGNSQCVNAMRWIGQRIDYVDKYLNN